MPLLIRVLLAFCLTLFLLPAHADDNAAGITRLMEDSGLLDALHGFNETLGATLAHQDPDTLSAQHVATLSEKAGIAFAPGFLEKSMQDDLTEQVSPKDLAEILAWLDTDLGRKISRLESREEITKRLSVETVSPAISPARSRLLARLLKSSNFADIMVDIQYRLVEAMLAGMAYADPARTAGVQPMLADLRARRPQELVQVNATLSQDFQRVYEPLSDDELTRYVAFSESPLGKRYSTAVSHAFNSGLNDAAQSFGQLLASP